MTPGSAVVVEVDADDAPLPDELTDTDPALLELPVRCLPLLLLLLAVLPCFFL